MKKIAILCLLLLACLLFSSCASAENDRTIYFEVMVHIPGDPKSVSYAYNLDY